MTADFLPQFRRRLFEWLQFRVADGRTPFRRVEEAPELLHVNRLGAPDLLLWINRDSLLAGAMILIPAKSTRELLLDAGDMAASLGLRQFVTWEAREVNIWATGPELPAVVNSWPIPGSGSVSPEDFALVFEQLLQELRNLAVSAVLPPEQLPASYFANLCRQVLRDLEAPLAEIARVSARKGQTDSCSRCDARDKGWLTLWRLLALLWNDRLPPGINPERLDRAIGYALADPDCEAFSCLAPVDGEAPLPEHSAVRFHHLAGRLTQLGWRHNPERALTTLRLLFAAAARDCAVETTALDSPPAPGTLLVNHLPPQPLTGTTVIAPAPCLAGLALLNSVTGSHMPLRMLPGVASLTDTGRPPLAVAALGDRQPLSAAQRRLRLTALRRPWPYRRFQLAVNTPAWIWDALHLGGLTDTQGQLQLTLPGDWAESPGSPLLWSALSARQALTELRLHEDGRQTLILVGHDKAPETLAVQFPDGTRRQHPALLDNTTVDDIAALSLNAVVPPPRFRNARKPAPLPADKIAAKVFVDGVPRFPEQYLRRLDCLSLRTHHLPGPLQPNSHFFDHIRLTGPDGSHIDCDSPADAEALQLASRDGRQQVVLPADPVVTLRLIAAYQEDLQRLWQQLVDECRRHHPAQRKALALARRLWRERNLPPTANR